MVSILTTADNMQDTARRLLAAADNPTEVATDTTGVGLAFVVSDELARKAGFIADGDDLDDTPEQDRIEDVDVTADLEKAADEVPDADTENADTAADDDLENTIPESEQTAITEEQFLPEPPRSGKGSGDEVWRPFLINAGVTIPGDVTKRDDLIALWDERATGR